MDVAELTGGPIASGVIALLSFPVAIVTLVFTSILHYSCWKALPERYRSTSPGKAVGFLFIPFYNFYWVFISFPGLAKGYVKFKKDAGIEEIRDQTGLAITYAILIILSLTLGFFPGFTSAIQIADLVVFILFYQSISSYANIAILHSRRS